MCEPATAMMTVALVAGSAYQAQQQRKAARKQEEAAKKQAEAIKEANKKPEPVKQVDAMGEGAARDRRRRRGLASTNRTGGALSSFTGGARKSLLGE